MSLSHVVSRGHEDGQVSGLLSVTMLVSEGSVASGARSIQVSRPVSWGHDIIQTRTVPRPMSGPLPRAVCMSVALWNLGSEVVSMAPVGTKGTKGSADAWGLIHLGPCWCLEAMLPGPCYSELLNHKHTRAAVVFTAILPAWAMFRSMALLQLGQW